MRSVEPTPQSQREEGTSATSDSLRRRVLARDTVFGAFIFTDSPGNAEIVARSGVDWVLFDMEHGATTEATLSSMIMATRGTAATPLARVEIGERIRVGRALDLGVQGVMVPQVHSAQAARAVVRWMRTQPAGDRGIAMFTRGMDFGGVGHDGVAGRHEELLTLVQVESRQAVDEVEQIAAIDGVDVLFVGPTDLTHALGIPGRIDEPLYEDTIRRVAAAAKASGKAAGVLVWKPDDVERYAALGYTFFALTNDSMILDRAVRTALSEARSGTQTALAGAAR